MDPKNRWLIVAFGLFSVFIVVFGLWNIRETIVGPFRLPKSNNQEISSAEIKANLATSDSDRDGINDSDEIFKYHTSVYLDDSDSDSYTDKQEVEAGSNPLDPLSTPLTPNPNSEVVQPQLGITNQPEQNINTAQSANESSSQGLSSQEIRSFLIQLGVSADLLNNVDDATMRTLFDEAIKDSGLNLEQNFSNSQSADDTASQNVLTDPNNVSVEEIKQMLLSSGFDAEALKKIDDATLKQMFIEAYNKNNQ